jgi:NADH:ubiquinone oxidoreductase subunit H
MDIEFNLLFVTLVSICLNIIMFFSGYFSKNKYAAISAMRMVGFIACAELLLTVLNLILIHVAQSFQIAANIVIQEECIFIFNVLPILTIIILTILVEVNKSPFDLSEAETELVTGFHTEYGAFFFALFYLGEYFHIFFTSAFVVIMFLGA